MKNSNLKYISEPAVSLKTLIDVGLINSGVKVYSSLNGKISGTLNPNGSITLNIKGIIKDFPYPSGAARAIENRSLNGWIYWMIEENGIKYDLAYFRNKFIESNERNPTPGFNVM